MVWRIQAKEGLTRTFESKRFPNCESYYIVTCHFTKGHAIFLLHTSRAKDSQTELKSMTRLLLSKQPSLFLPPNNKFAKVVSYAGILIEHF